MIITGDIAASSDGKVIPSDTDTIVVVVASNGQILTSAQSSIAGGSYGVTVSQEASFNGTTIALRLKHGSSTFKLLTTSGTDATVPFNGAVLPLGRTIVNVVASSKSTDPVTGTGSGTGTGTGTGNGTDIPTISSSGSGSTTPAISASTADPTLQSGDINGDGRTDEADIARLKDALAGKIAIDKTKMDVNSDGVVNSRDLIDLIRAVRALARDSLQPVVAVPKR